VASANDAWAICVSSGAVRNVVRQAKRETRRARRTDGVT